MKLKGDKCQCAACGLHFTSTWSFDGHRRGPYTERRCLPEKSLNRAGFKQDSNQFWRLPG